MSDSNLVLAAYLFGEVTYCLAFEDLIILDGERCTILES